MGRLLKHVAECGRWTGPSGVDGSHGSCTTKTSPPSSSTSATMVLPVPGGPENRDHSPSPLASFAREAPLVEDAPLVLDPGDELADVFGAPLGGHDGLTAARRTASPRRGPSSARPHNRRLRLARRNADAAGTIGEPGPTIWACPTTPSARCRHPPSRAESPISDPCYLPVGLKLSAATAKARFHFG